MFVIESLKGPSHRLGLLKNFAGQIIIPAALGAAHVGAALHAGRKSDIHEGTEWIIESALDSSTRIALFILPAVVLLGWVLDIPDMSLVFHSFQVVLLGIAILYHGR
jgi:calcium/proton exchanger cax